MGLNIKTKYLALLRGINVGGNNIIKMADLKLCFESMDLGDVQTYIQSGNVLFTSEVKDIATLITKIEQGLSERFSYTSRLVLISHAQLRQVVDEAPGEFGKDMVNYMYDVLFVKEPLTTTEAIKNVKPKEGVDQAFSGELALYFSRLISKASQSHLTKIIAMPIYKNITIRNWNTTTKLLTLMEK